MFSLRARRIPQVDPLAIYNKFDSTAAAAAIPDGSRIVWTPSFKRMYVA